MKRIYAGLVKYGKRDDHVHDVQFQKKYFSGNPDHQVQGLDAPIGVITTKDHHALVTATHLSTYYGNFGLHDIESPSPTVTTKDSISKVDVTFIDNQYRTGVAASVEMPGAAITTVPKVNVVIAKKYIFNPAWGRHHSSVDHPCCTVVASQHKAPLYIVTSSTGSFELPIFEQDSQIVVKIKQFMVANGIVDIKMRMLKICELKQIQGFPKDYVLQRRQTEQKKYIGNAVEVNQAAAIVAQKMKALSRYSQAVAR